MMHELHNSYSYRISYCELLFNEKSHFWLVRCFFPFQFLVEPVSMCEADMNMNLVFFFKLFQPLDHCLIADVSIIRIRIHS